MAPVLKQIERPICGSPAWDRDLASVAMGDHGCPVSTAVTAEYSRDWHYFLRIDEEPTEFGTFALSERFAFTDREFWVWSCPDGYGRTRDLIVGQSRTPIYEKTGDRVWMRGEFNEERHNPRDMTAREYPEHNDAMGKAN